MRTLKFRAYDNNNKKMYHFYDQWLCSEYQSMAFKVQEDQEGTYCTDFDEDDLSPLMQFTGLLDKNGVEIYEGDVLQYENTKALWFRREVTFKDGCFCYENMGDIIPLNKRHKEFEVIGNVYQNPDLLDKQTV